MEIKKINSYLTQAAQKAQEQNPRPAGADDKTAARELSVESDRVNWSSGYQEMTQVKKVAMERDEIRLEKVDPIRAMIENGTYVIDAEAIASKMLEEH